MLLINDYSFWIVTAVAAAAAVELDSFFYYT